DPSWHHSISSNRYNACLSVNGILITGHDVDAPDDSFRFRTHEIDGKQTVGQFSAGHLHPLSEEESALELPCSDAPVQILPGLVVRLPPAKDELALLQEDFELSLREAGNRQRDAQGIRRRFGARKPLDIIRRIAVARGLRHPVEGAL